MADESQPNTRLEGKNRMSDSRTALISAWNKEGLADFARGLKEMGWTLYASGGTARTISQAGMEVIPTETITGIDSILGGRVKTLHPELHAAILAQGDDREQRRGQGKVVFDLVAVDLYPFRETRGMDPMDPGMVELIDIGGPTMARAAAKNWKHVISATGSAVFPMVLDSIRKDGNDSDFRRLMACMTFDATSRYDMEIVMAMESGLVPELRYGENPHQNAAVHFPWPRQGFGRAEILGGRAISYNNYLDADAAWSCTRDMPAGMPAAVLMKHGNPCGAGVGSSPAEAFHNAFRADRDSPYGGILSLNCQVDMELVAQLKGLFLEIVMAPSFAEDALERLRKRKKLRILRMPEGVERQRQMRSIWGGILRQDPDSVDGLEEVTVPTDRKPTEEELKTMDLLWRVCRSVKSNAIVVGDINGTLGVGAGQMSRIESLDLAVIRAVREGHDLQ